MQRSEYEDLFEKYPLLEKIRKGQEIVWLNPDKTIYKKSMEYCELTIADIDDAAERLERFAPFIEKCFPETKENRGIIESPLVEIPRMKKLMEKKYHSHLEGKLLLKMDSHLAIAGSVKARGGIYEVLVHTEELALANGILKKDDSYEKLADTSCAEFFHNYMIQVGSTGNLGLSIGIMSAVIGYQVIVHMSSDARQWKKDLLRSYGVTVIEYETDYSEAVEKGRRLSDENPNSYFVDDENSRSLFLGYAVAAKRLNAQLKELKTTVDEEHPLLVYIPCGVGGAPGGISFGLKQEFGDAVHCFFVEPTQAPCMVIGMMTDLHSKISVQDIGLTGLTHADGLAVGRPSAFVGNIMKRMLSGEFTVQDGRLYDYMRDLIETEEIFLEPSACAAFQGPMKLSESKEMKEYLEKNQLNEKMEQATHIVWATGGSLVPESVRKEYCNMIVPCQ